MRWIFILAELKKYANQENAKILQRFFKTGKGEYGEGDVFIGVRVPDIRKVAKENKDISLKKVEKLLQNKIHEARLLGLLILTYKKLDKEIYDLYLRNTKYVNNWDLVDLTAHKIVGKYLENKNRNILYKLAKSKSLWEKRISIISCFWFIKDKDFEDAIKISEILLHDKHDLIHKAVGWMLREIGNRDQCTEEKFLDKYHKVMPRTMLRYSIERFSDKKRKYYMKR